MEIMCRQIILFEQLIYRTARVTARVAAAPEEYCPVFLALLREETVRVLTVVGLSSAPYSEVPPAVVAVEAR